MLRILLPALVVLAATRPARADDDLWQVHSSGNLAVDGGFVAGFPAALPTGLSTGIGAGVTRGGTLAWGARASWTSATESSSAWTVTQSDLRLRATGSIAHTAGRGTMSLRLGLGTTLVHEHRLRQQGSRAGLTGSDLETSAWDALPAADFEGVVVLHVLGDWAMVVSGGPTLERRDGSFWGGWTAELGVSWQP